jgi:glycosyltransferase involved in cell wall biosynthesis
MWKDYQNLSSGDIIFVLDRASDLITKEVSLEELHNLGSMIFLGGFKWASSFSILTSNSDAIHVFGGFRNSWYFFPLILFAVFRNIKVAVINEPYSTSSIGYFQEEADWWARLKVKARPFLYDFMAQLLNRITRKVQPCFLPISLLAREQFIRAGFPLDSLYPFGYFVPRQSADGGRRADEPSKALRLVFVGSLLTTKGLDIAIKPVKKLCLDGFDVSLDIYGHGDSKRFLPSPSDCVKYKGPLPPQEVQAVMAGYDLLILPSRHDGWGVVINEALLQGVPVIISDKVGAKCLVESSGSGLIFESENIEDLTRKLLELLQQPEKLEEMRRKARLVGDAILPAAGASYLLDVFLFHFYHKGQRPSALWTGSKII